MERADAHFVECTPLGGIGVSRINHVEAGGGTPEVLPTYKFTYISQSGSILGIPVDDTDMAGLDVDGVAVNVGGGIVGLPFTGHPFTIGEAIFISGTTNYDGGYTLGAGTTANQIRITKEYTAETFDGTEVVVKSISGLTVGNGHMVQDSSGNMYYGHLWYAAGSTYVTKIEPDGTLVYDFLNHSWTNASYECYGLGITSDDLYLYIVYGAAGFMWLEKYILDDLGELVSGDLVWSVSCPSGGYDMTIDEDGNAYVAGWAGGNVAKFASADGTKTTLTLMGGPGAGYVTCFANFDVAVDNDLGIVAVGVQQFCSQAQDESVLYNFAVRSFDNSVGDQLAIGGTYITLGSDFTYNIGTYAIAVHDGYFYVLAFTPNPTIYKILWNGASLSIVDSVAGPAYGVGLYFDLYGNLVVVNQDESVGQTDVFWFYDTDLNYLGKIDNFSSSLLSLWDSSLGGMQMGGEAVFDGVLGVEEILGTDDYWQIFDSDGDELLFTNLIGETVCILADGVVYPSRVVDDNGRIDCSDFSTAKKLHIGLNYESKLKPMKPLSQAAMMSKKATCKQMGLSVHNTDNTIGRSTDIPDTGVRYGVRDDDMKQINFTDPQWHNKCDIDGLFTGSVNVTVPDGFSVNMPLQIITDAPLPCVVRAMIPKVDRGV